MEELITKNLEEKDNLKPRFQNEFDILTSFLPKQLGEDETKKICSDLISKLGASSIKDMGKVMGELKKLHSDEIDFAKAGSLIKELLNKSWNIPKNILMKLKQD